VLSLRELHRAARILQEKLAGASLRRIVQPDAQSLVLSFHIAAGKLHILLSCGSNRARICLAEPTESRSSSGSFGQYARARLAGSSLVGIEISGKDRQLGFRLRTKSESFLLLFSILGARSNVYLLDAGGLLLHSLRPLEETRRELKLGDAWKDPRGALPGEGLDRWENVADAEYLEAVAGTYRQLELRNEAEILGRRIAQAIKKERAFLNRKSVHLEEDLGKARRGEEFRREGELLKSVLHAVKPGDDRILATDYRTGQVIEIPLDPKLSPAANMEAVFARYQRESRGAAIILEQLQELESAQNRLDGVEQRLAGALKSEPPDTAALESLLSDPAIRRWIRRHSEKPPGAFAVPAKGKKRIPARLIPKRYKTQEGLEIWVGRSDEGNDYLTTRLARGNDLFFHLELYPGSHVVLRTEGRSDPSSASILDACELAVHFSRLKNAGSAEVHMAPVKNVKKPKGSKPGLVYVRSGKSIHLRRDSRRLANILASRID
jgi:predicted ribosome quality control (RQC) complex YloA/Tae2 family protein